MHPIIIHQRDGRNFHTRLPLPKQTVFGFDEDLISWTEFDGTVVNLQQFNAGYILKDHRTNFQPARRANRAL